jgi:hypothetical protein
MEKIVNYSLSFFSRCRGDAQTSWWDDLTPEIAAAAAARAKAAGCKPHDDSNERCGQPTTWYGPDVGEVLHKLSSI